MSSIVTDENRIRAFVTEAVKDALEQELPSLVKQATRKEWLTREEVKDLTGWSDRTLQHLRDTRQIPFAQHGRKILYPTEGFFDFLEAHRIEPRSEAPGAEEVE
jgi:hypothetical protein